MRLVFACVAALLVAATPPAPLADTPLPDARQEAQARALMDELRCLVCQNQTIADSNADMAGDMRAVVRQRIAAGESPAQVKAYLISRYGDWVTFAPPLSERSALLWAAPLLFLLAGALIAAQMFRRRRS